MLAKKKENVSRSAAALTSKTPFQIVEAYKAIRANLLFMLSTAAEKAVVVTSAEPSAGKSTTCSNLAITMAQTGAKVVIVDADMRKPVLHKIFRVSNNNGLSKLLSGLIKPEDCINKSIMPNLDLINAGPLPPNPTELMGSERMAGLLQTLSASYDYIFLDAPPINVVADSLMFLDKTAGAILVARQKQTHYDELQKAAESIRNLHSSVLGVVITDVSETNKPYAMYKSYKYKSYDYEYKKV